MRILLIEDDAESAELVAQALPAAKHEVVIAADGERGLALAGSRAFDVLIVDRMLPGIDGLTLIQRIREQGDRVPVLIVSALSDVDERIRGLRDGGDDYVTKPFAIDELLARVDALVRRAGDHPAMTFRLGDLRLDRLTREVTLAGEALELKPKEFQLLEQLMRHHGQVVTRSMLLEAVWGIRFDPGTNVVDVHVSRLRRKIERGAGSPRIETVRGAGYRLIGPD